MLLLALAMVAAPVPAPAATSAAQADAAVRKVIASPAYKKAVAALEAGHDKWVEDVITITQIAAPPFKEAQRAKAYLAMFQARGLTETEIDAEGNVLGIRRGTDRAAPLLVVSAHLDTVFPEGTNVTVRRDGEKLHAPGVGDDSAGLATQLALIDAMNAAGIRTRSDILFVGTVGEEGLGDLRGVRHLFTKGKYKDRAKAFISIDGVGLTGFTSGATGSKRYRVTFKGPGGHSFSAFGIVNPMAALGETVSALYKVPVPTNPKTTFSASVVGGGTSVNAIPEEVWLEVDMRSNSAAELGKLERNFLEIVTRSVETENAARSTARGRITADPKPIGDRPAGRTPETADIVRLAVAAHRAEGITAELGAGSTDANVPISLGIPAVTLSGAASGAGAHAPDEWVGIEKAANLKLKRIRLATILVLAGLR
jgi:acetylornithine deacetylase/succinyl-diaminopimelate desuccinylase-like protein